MNNPVFNEVKPQQQNAPIPMNANPQINLVANLQINQNPNPVAVPIIDVIKPEQQQNVSFNNNTKPVSETIITTQETITPSSEYDTTEYTEEQEYDTGHEYMDLQEELDFDEDDEDEEDNKLNLETVEICLYRIRTDLQTPFLEFLVERTDENPQFHLPLYKEDNSEEIKETAALQNNLLRKIEILFNNDETLETPRFLGFQKNTSSSFVPLDTKTEPSKPRIKIREETVVAFYDLTEYSVSEPYVKDGSVQWVLLNQITMENGFQPETIDFFQKNIHIRTLYHIPTQEEVPPPILVYHSFQTATRTDDPVFGFPFVFTEKPIYPVENSPETESATEKQPETEKQPVENPETESKTESTKEKQPVENPEKDDLKSATDVEPTDDDKKPKQNILSYINPLSTTNRSYTFILFPPSLEKTLVILKEEFQNISPELLKKYNDVFLKKVCIRFLKNNVDHWIVKSPVVAFPYLPFQPFKEKKGTFSAKPTKVSFLPGKITSSILTTPSKKQPVAQDGHNGPSSFHLNLEKLLNPHRITERANLINNRQ